MLTTVNWTKCINSEMLRSENCRCKPLAVQPFLCCFLVLRALILCDCVVLRVWSSDEYVDRSMVLVPDRSSCTSLKRSTLWMCCWCQRLHSPFFFFFLLRFLCCLFVDGIIWCLRVQPLLLSRLQEHCWWGWEWTFMGLVLAGWTDASKMTCFHFWFDFGSNCSCLWSCLFFW